MRSESPTATRPACRVLLLGLLLIASFPAQGQSTATPDIQAALQQARRETVQRALTGETVPLEGALDPATYVVGPGDVFNVYAGGALASQTSVTVGADGLLIVPDVGSFDVADQTLAEVRSVVREGLRRAYRNVDTDLTLLRPRQFYVHVAGTVTQPGRHVVVPVARVEDALAAAMDEVSPLLMLRELRTSENLTGERAFLPALRSVELRRRDGSTEVVDLWRYYTSGDTRYNPYVRDGDALYVPAFRDDLSAVTIEGEVSNPGSYDYREGDTALDLLAIATSDFENLGRVRLLRRTGEARTLDAAAMRAGRDENPALTPGDRMIVAQRNRVVGVASVAGYVQYPGSYPIVRGETTLKDLVAAAGGLEPDALVRGAYLERRGTMQSATLEPDQLTPFREIPLETNVSPQIIEQAIESEISGLTRNSTLSFAARQFYGRELLQPQRVSVDVAAVLAGNAPPVPLLDGDRLVIPRDPQAVLVVGQVERPGYVPFRAGADADYYIAQAGGRGSAAAETFVRVADTGRIRPSTGAALQSGDYVFVDRVGASETPAIQSIVLQERALELQQQQQNQTRRLQYIQTGLAFVSTVAAFVTTYIALTRDTQ